MKKGKTKTNNNDTYSFEHRILCLQVETDTAVKLLKLGLGELQKITYYSDFCYPIPLLLLSSSFERLLKCLLVLLNIKKDKGFSSKSFKTNHKIDELLETLLLLFEGKGDVLVYSQAKSDLAFLSNDKYLTKIVSCLSKFAQGGRYYHLDIISEGKMSARDPRREWNEIETDILNNNKILKKQLHSGDRDQAFEKINEELVKLLEKFASALSRIFESASREEYDINPKMIVGEFSSLSDNDLGKINY